MISTVLIRVVSMVSCFFFQFDIDKSEKGETIEYTNCQQSFKVRNHRNLVEGNELTLKINFDGSREVRC